MASVRSYLGPAPCGLRALSLPKAVAIHMLGLKRLPLPLDREEGQGSQAQRQSQPKAWLTDTL